MSQKFEELYETSSYGTHSAYNVVYMYVLLHISIPSNQTIAFVSIGIINDFNFTVFKYFNNLNNFIAIWIWFEIIEENLLTYNMRYISSRCVYRLQK